MRDNIQLQYWLEQIALFNDEASFEQLFLHYNGRLFHLANSFVKMEEAAEEIVSDVFVNVWRNRSRLLEIENIDVYLYVAIKNLSLKQIGKHTAQSTFSIDDLHFDHLQSTCLTPEEMLVSKEILNRIYQAIESLPPKCRLIFKLVREDGLRYKDISQILNISVKTIDAQMAIAAKKVTQTLRMSLSR
jgi:RNA polymerase sigma-70 factor (family 1)